MDSSSIQAMRYSDKDYEETHLLWTEESDPELFVVGKISDNGVIGIMNLSEQDSDFELESNPGDSGSDEDESSEKAVVRYKMTKKVNHLLEKLYVATLSAQHQV
ncbi:hypothetical protein QE152_g30006 [Popillia japonica]|uniref:Uncharacterized protein n=1 Tax=Popillia japonica TaxID=7064 RepID=A0AAW1JG35_POPJA